MIEPSFDRVGFVDRDELLRNPPEGFWGQSSDTIAAVMPMGPKFDPVTGEIKKVVSVRKMRAEALAKFVSSGRSNVGVRKSNKMRSTYWH